MTSNRVAKMRMRLATALALLAVCGACSGSAGESSSIEAVEAQIEITPESAAERAITVQNELQSCMLAAGFDYEPIAIEARSEHVGVRYHLDLLDEEVVAIRGFGLAEPRTGYVNPNFEHTQELSASEQQAWRSEYGTCRTDVNQRVAERYTDVNELSLSYQALREAFEATPGAAHLNTQWGRCMRENGFQDAPDSIDEFVSDLATEANRIFTASSPNERDAAMADQFERERAAAMTAAACAAPIAVEYRSAWLDFSDENAMRS